MRRVKNTAFEKDAAELAASYINNRTTRPARERPAHPTVGEIWIDPSSRKGYAYNGVSWVDTGMRSLL